MISKLIRYGIIAAGVLTTLPAQAFCGFYVAKADTNLFNEASKVVMVRDGNRTVMTMANDFQGDVKDFAMVIPVPSVLEEGQINVADSALITHLDAYTAPRLVEYFDDDPCLYDGIPIDMMEGSVPTPMPAEARVAKSNAQLGVTVEAQYQIGEYDISILSATESDGLIIWLNQNGYKVSNSAQQTLTSYIRQGMKFFVAKVELEAFQSSGYEFLRPIQIAYEHPRFMLPVRLGTENSKGDQDLFLFALTRKGRVETTNYRTVKLPSDINVPVFVKNEFDDFYKAMFAHQVEKERKRAVFTEYAWDMSWCDPCAADPLSAAELRQLGVFWVGSPTIEGEPLTSNQGIMPISEAQDVYVTRLHARYNKQTFPEDLMLQVTTDRENFQGRYVINHPWEPESNKLACEAAETYLNRELPERQQQEAKNLAKLTGWSIHDIRSKISKPGYYEYVAPASNNSGEGNWWDDLWESQQ